MSYWNYEHLMTMVEAIDRNTKALDRINKELFNIRVGLDSERLGFVKKDADALLAERKQKQSTGKASPIESESIRASSRQGPKKGVTKRKDRRSSESQ